MSARVAASGVNVLAVACFAAIALLEAGWTALAATDVFNSDCFDTDLRADILVADSFFAAVFLARAFFVTACLEAAFFVTACLEAACLETAFFETAFFETEFFAGDFPATGFLATDFFTTGAFVIDFLEAAFLTVAVTCGVLVLAAAALDDLGAGIPVD